MKWDFSFMTRCNAPKHKYEVGYDELEPGASHIGYGINVHFANGRNHTHYDQIKVYGDPELRDKIIELLNQDNEDLKKTEPDNGTNNVKLDIMGEAT